MNWRYVAANGWLRRARPFTGARGRTFDLRTTSRVQDIKYLTNKSVARLETADFVRLSRAEEANFITVTFSPSKLSDALVRVRQWESLVVSSGHSVYAFEWNQERVGILRVRTPPRAA